MSWVVISPDYILRSIEILGMDYVTFPVKVIHSWFWRHTRFWRWNNFLFVHSIFLKRHWILESINIMLSFSSALGYCAYISHYYFFISGCGGPAVTVYIHFTLSFYESVRQFSIKITHSNRFCGNESYIVSSSVNLNSFLYCRDQGHQNQLFTFPIINTLNIFNFLSKIYLRLLKFQWTFVCQPMTYWYSLIGYPL